MKKTTLSDCRALRLLAAALLLLTVSVSANAYDFSAVNGDGKTIYYNITSSTTCGVTYLHPYLSEENSNSDAYTGYVTIPETVTHEGSTYSVTSIGDHAFNCCGELTEVSIPESVTTIGGEAFVYCTSMVSVNIPQNVTRIEYNVFLGCSSLTSVDLHEGITYIGTYVFSDCTALKELTIPSSVKEIGCRAFFFCTGLTAVYFNAIDAEVVEYLQPPFEGCSTPATLTIGDGVTRIAEHMFEGYTGITRAIIPESVTEIEGGAFYDCKGLTSLTSHNPEPPTCAENVFLHVPTSTCVLYVPEGSKDAYSTAYAWEDFLNIEEIGTTAIVKTYEATVITYLTATLNGTVKAGPEEILEQGFEYWTDSGEVQTVTATGEEMSVTLTELQEYTTYTYRAYAITSSGTIYGEEVTFTTMGEELSYDFSAVNDDGVTIYYVITSSSTCKVTYRYPHDAKEHSNSDTYSGYVTIPETVTHEGSTYSVTSIGDYAFYSCEGLYGVSIPNTVSTIGIYAFEYCTGLTEINLPEAVTVINSDTFHYCEKLASITMSDDVNQIGHAAFEGCYNLSEITIAQNLTTICSYAFQYCYELTLFPLPESVTTIENHAFAHCTGLTEFTIPESVTSVGEATFEGCTSLVSIEIPNNMSSIPSYLCKDCPSLTSVLIPESVTSIDYEAFWACTGLESVTSLNPEPPTCGEQTFYNVPTNSCVLYVPEGAKVDYASADTWKDFYYIVEIGAIAIVQTYEATNITDNSVTLNGSVTAGSDEILEQGFEYWTDGSNVQTVTTTGEDMSVTLTELQENTTYTYRAYATTESGTTYGEQVSFTTLEEEHSYDFKENGIYYIITSSSTCKVTYLYPYNSEEHSNSDAYSGYVTIPETVTHEGITYSVTSVGDHAFYSCEGLYGVSIPNTVTSIGDGAFERSGLTEVTIPEKVSSIVETSFYRCYSLAMFEVAEGNSYFCSQDGVLYTKDMKTLRQFPPASPITSYNIPESVTSIYRKAFLGCASLKELFIPESVTTIESEAFTECANLISVNIPQSVTRIELNVFLGCSSLTSVDIHEGITYIGTYAFSYCTSLKELTIPSSVKEIGCRAFYGCTGLTAVYFNAIDAEVVQYSQAPFEGCSTPATLTIGDGVTRIAEHMFESYTGITSAIIPASVTEIEGKAFYDCKGLTSITSLNPEPPTCGEQAFYNVPTNTCVLYVPEGSKEAYSTAYAWEDFLNIEEIEIDVIAPTIQTSEATDITYNSATLNGSVEAGTEEILEQGFEYWTDGSDVQRVTATGEEMSATLTGLEQNTTYTYRSYATTESGTTYGDEVTFTTLEEEHSYDFSAVNDDEVTIYYNITSSSTCEVTYLYPYNSEEHSNSDAYSGYVTIPETVTHEGITYSVTSIGDHAFYSCEGLYGVSIPNTVSTIRSYAFEYCRGLTEINLPEDVTVINSDAFHYCEKLASITMSENVYEIGFAAFEGCYNLSEITIPQNLTTICAYAFQYCYELTSFPLPESVTTIEHHAFAHCTGLTEFAITESVTSVGDATFEGCTSLVSIEFPNNMSSIPSYLCNDCPSMTSILIPESVTSINYQAFRVCTGLESVTLLNPEPPTCGEQVFYNVPTNTCVLYVPEGSKEAYSTAYAWEDFLNIEEIVNEVVAPTVQTAEATDITYNSVTLNGSVTEGDEEILEHGFEYWTDGSDVQRVTATGEDMSVTLTGLEQSTTYIYRAYATTASGTTYGEEMTFTTGIGMTLTIAQTSLTPDSYSAVGSYEEGDAAVTETGFIGYETDGTNLLLTNLDPETSYTVTYYVIASECEYTTSVTFTTPAVEFTTLPAKATSNTAAMLCATTNLSDNATGTGIEWRRYDAPDIMPSTQSECPVIDGELTGTLKGLDPSTYYMYRPYYTSAAGNTYYGDWIAFITADAYVYFEPTVHTYEAVSVGSSSVTVKAAAVEGSDDIISQGFEYWEGTSSSAQQVKRVSSDDDGVTRVEVSGQWMTVTFEDLKPGTTYSYRAYVTSEVGTTYGETMSFTTEVPTGIYGRLAEEMDIYEIARYTLDGKKISHPMRGMNIVRYSDGTSKKVLVK